HEAPLEPGGEPGAAPPAKPGRFHLVDDGAGLHAEGLLESLIAPPLDPAGVGARLGVAEVLGEADGFLGMRRMRIPHALTPPRSQFPVPSSQCHPYLTRIPGTRSGVTLSWKSSSTITGVANPHAPRHSTSMTVNRPCALVAPSSPHPVAWRIAFVTSS